MARRSTRPFTSNASSKQRIAQFPESGRIVPELQRAEIRDVIVGSYRIVYLVGADVVHILTVFHGARLFPLPTDAV
ncbi:MAG: type II toxin-antitoxin system RelE/ParE family toxin [Gemmatimonadota bacterium]